VALKVDVIVAGGTPQALAAKQATRTVPIVFAAAGDPVTSGLVTSLARPGGNVTGLTGLGPELVGKGLEQLTQAVPGVSRVAAVSVPMEGVCRCRGPYGLWSGPCRFVSARRHLRGQDSQGRQAGGTPSRTTDQVRAGDQPQDRQDARPHDPAVAAEARGSDH